MMVANDLRELLAALESRPLIAEGSKRRRLPKRTSKFIRRKVESCKSEGKTVRHCVAWAYWRAKRKGLL